MTTSANVSEHRLDVLRQLQPQMEDLLKKQLKSVADSWQPSDFLPDMASEKWAGELSLLRRQSQDVSDELLISLVGNMITEEALPSYEGELIRHEAVPDEGDRPFSRWIRGWTAEENRHGDILNRYLYLTGRVDMRSIEYTIQHLLRNGFTPNADSDRYQALIYTSFQERATKISHGNVARLAAEQGDRLLSRICATVTGDEGRHESFYKDLMGGVFKLDPEGAVTTFQQMMKRAIAMPGKLMDDGETVDLFSQYSAVAQRIGVYTASDYADIFIHLMDHWGIRALAGLTGAAARARDRLCGLAEQIHELAEWAIGKMEEKEIRLPWVYHRAVGL